MEIPKELKTLYKHWESHTKASESKNTDIEVDNKVLKSMEDFAVERMRIWEKKFLRQNPPWTADSILQKYRFCNIYRELDRQTIAFHELLKDYREDFAVWLLNMMFCRLVLNPETVRKVGLLSFDEKNNKKVFENLKNLPSPKYGTAYIFPVSLIMRTQFPTREEFFCLYLPKVMKLVAEEIETFNKISVVDALKRILPVFGFNLKFHWTEVLIDVAYQYPEYIDLFKKFPIGPGSAPTMKKLNSGADPENICLSLINYQPVNFSYLEYDGSKIYLSVENWEGIGCEFRKYSNLLTGTGRKRIYRS